MKAASVPLPEIEIRMARSNPSYLWKRSVVTFKLWYDHTLHLSLNGMKACIGRAPKLGLMALRLSAEAARGDGLSPSVVRNGGDLDDLNQASRGNLWKALEPLVGRVAARLLIRSHEAPAGSCFLAVVPQAVEICKSVTLLFHTLWYKCVCEVKKHVAIIDPDFQMSLGEIMGDLRHDFGFVKKMRRACSAWKLFSVSLVTLGWDWSHANTKEGREWIALYEAWNEGGPNQDWFRG